MFSPPDLPIVATLQPLQAALLRHPNVILSAPPGSGKTTVVPLALLDAPWLAGERILMLEPRRLAARAAASRMAELLQEPVGERVGYQIRFERKVGPNTRVEVVTEGMLTRRLQSDPALQGVGAILFDEFHERSLQGDLGLALALELQQLRDDLRLLVMSATLESQRLAKLLGDAPIIEGHGRSYPVQVRYASQPYAHVVEGVVQTIRQALAQERGDLLAFLPGAGEIRRVEAALRSGLPDDVTLLPLYGELGMQAQDRAVRPWLEGGRRVILATDIAETSLTIPGIRVVVDGGLCKRPRFHASSGLTRLERLRISDASAQQRAGRAGRLEPGVCYRIWPESQQRMLQPATPAEIREADLAPLLLELALWGVADPTQMSWLDPPPEGAVAQGWALLVALGAVDEARHITPLGRQMAQLPLHPRLAHMVCMAPEPAAQAMACDVAALLSERDPLKGGARQVDLHLRWQSVAQFRRQGSAGPGVDAASLQRIVRGADQLRHLLGVSRQQVAHGDLGLLLAAAYPDRVAQLRPGQRGRYLLASGRGVRLDEMDPLSGEPLLVVAALDAGEAEGRAYLAVSLAQEAFMALQPPAWQAQVVWSDQQQRVVAERQRCFGALVLERQPLHGEAPEAAVLAAMLVGVRRMGLAVLPWTPAAMQYQARVQLMARLESGWPLLEEAVLLEQLEQWLAPFLRGVNRRAQLERLNMLEILQSQLTWSQQQSLEQALPTHYEVPSGSRIKLDYTAGAQPVLAVRIQELFGLAESPCLGQGRVPVTLHLLNPAQRPVQVTSDLRGFWQTTWPQVRKELRGRYPKHHWPENPWQAQATARAKPRS
ncbi:ATP-dependent helicase HrpB [Magnetococcus marinus MC-1]|uniref:ATP-dependent helicase HrpB n=1 Tax=Magnetococcus marinus (strain ATCC BAA-1437 / JCM 17883 / MC-1) TaxID=156889 RepID=A0L6K8_MAGMM|nr:ATP-dependent helicase HrpB [Magnetococcus marinus]ABK43601.1 ATP-dependent helicase HrpB [Magnetococcus marinus MC-1]